MEQVMYLPLPEDRARFIIAMSEDKPATDAGSVSEAVGADARDLEWGRAVEQVERVARAICAESYACRLGNRYPDDRQTLCGTPMWQGYVAEARAAIAVMAEDAPATDVGSVSERVSHVIGDVLEGRTTPQQNKALGTAVERAQRVGSDADKAVGRVTRYMPGAAGR